MEDEFATDDVVLNKHTQEMINVVCIKVKHKLLTM